MQARRSLDRKLWRGETASTISTSKSVFGKLTYRASCSHFEGLNLRLYNPQSHQWSLNFANSKGGSLSQPTIGEFKNGRGEFFDQETLDGRALIDHGLRPGDTVVTAGQYRLDDGVKVVQVPANDPRVQENSEASSGML